MLQVLLFPKRMDDKAAFRERLQSCIDASGTLYALAKKIGSPPNTIRRYFGSSEPTRPKLLAIAAATGVSVEWLATGRGPRLASNIPPASYSGASLPSAFANVEQEKPSEMGEGFRARVAESIKLEGGLEAIAEISGLSKDRLSKIMLGAEMSVAELSKLSRATRTPVSWLVHGRGFDQSDFIVAEKSAKKLLQEMEMIDERRAGGFRKLGDLDRSAWKEGSLPAIFSLWLRIFEKLGPAFYQIHEVQDNVMSHTLEQNDLVVIELKVQPTTPGIYLLRTENRQFLARCVGTPNGYSYTFDNKQYNGDMAKRFVVAGDQIECVGRAIEVFGPPK